MDLRGRGLSDKPPTGYSIEIIARYPGSDE